MSIRECKSTRASVAVAILLVSGVARAATGGAPLTIAHSGYLLDGADAPLSSASLAMKFRIFDADAGASGNLQWEGTCATVQVARGYYTVLLGSTACPGTGGVGDSILDTSDVPTTGERWLEVEVGGVTMSPRMAVATVPTAAVASRALNADALGGFLASNFAKVGTLTAGKWCTASEDADKVVCESAAPAVTGAQANTGTSPGVACTGSTAGTFWYDTTASAVMVCNGAEYTTVNAVSAPPGAPGSPTVSPANASLAVSWSTVAGTTSYEVGYEIGSVIDGSATVVVVASGTSTTLSGLTNGTSYAVAVRSVTGTYNSAWSAVTTGTPGTPCSNSTQCSTGQVCLSGACGACSSNSQCSGSMVCQGGACTACTSDTQCGAGSICLSGACSGLSCKSYHDSGVTQDGPYQVDPDGGGPLPPFVAWCDMTTDGGGWTLVGVGATLNTNQQSPGNGAVGTVTSPTQASFGRLAFSTWNALGTISRWKGGSRRFFTRYGSSAITLGGWQTGYNSEPSPSCSSNLVNWTSGRGYHVADCYDVNATYIGFFWNVDGGGGGNDYVMNSAGGTVWVR